MSVTSTSSASTSSVSIAATAAAGGITVTQPAETAATSYYKIYSGVEVTFGWNFTSVSSYFNSLTVQAYCSDNSNTYPIATIAGTATEAVWAPYNYSVSAAANGQPALVMETYRLQIYGDKGLSAAASPGIMSPNDDTEFALYIPQSYTPLACELQPLQRSCDSASAAMLTLTSPVAFASPQPAGRACRARTTAPLVWRRRLSWWPCLQP